MRQQGQFCVRNDSDALIVQDMKPRISMITLGVHNLEKAVKFYENGLGFPKMESPPEVAFFNLNGTWLGLYGRKALAEDAGISPEGNGFGGFALAHNVPSESEVDDVLGLAVAAGGTLVKKAEKASWGGYSGYFKDPEGHLWEVAHNPLFWVGPAD
jgi:catechol 2,3-dioxygenase-like lactoylglutathione lyase family enzyme